MIKLLIIHMSSHITNNLLIANHFTQLIHVHTCNWVSRLQIVVMVRGHCFTPSLQCRGRNMSDFRVGSAPGKSFLQHLPDSQSREREAEVTVSEQERGAEWRVSIATYVCTVVHTCSFLIFNTLYSHPVCMWGNNGIYVYNRYQLSRASLAGLVMVCA